MSLTLDASTTTMVSWTNTLDTSGGGQIRIGLPSHVEVPTGEIRLGAPVNIGTVQGRIKSISYQFNSDSPVSMAGDVAHGPGNYLSFPSVTVEVEAPTSGASSALSFMGLNQSDMFVLSTDSTLYTAPVYLTPPTRTDLMRARIRAQMAGANVPSKYLSIVKDSDPEGKARGLLREMIGLEAYREYLRRGFVMVRGRSGLLYKVMRGTATQCIEVMGRTMDGGYGTVESLCVVFQDSNLPPTDSVIMRVLMCRYDEFGLRARANVFHGPVEKRDLAISDMAKSLIKVGEDKQKAAVESTFRIASGSDYIVTTPEYAAALNRIAPPLRAAS